MKKKLLLFILMALSGFSYAHDKQLEFVENVGQWEEEILFKSQLGSGAVFLERDGFVFNMRSPEDLVAAHNRLEERENTPIRGHAWKLQFLNTTGPEKLIHAKKNDAYYNFFIGNDPSKWKSHVHSYAEITYVNLWPGVDLKVYSHNHPRGCNFKYDFIVHPGADPNQIQFSYQGTDDVVYQSEELQLITSIGSFIEAKPIAFQDDGSNILCYYKQTNQAYSYNFPSGYDLSRELVIDPELIAATFVGMSGADAYGMCATFNAENEIISSSLPHGVGLPQSLGAYSDTFIGGGTDMGISKFNPSGSELIWNTYLGGNSGDLPISLIVNNTLDIYILGVTFSSDFPTLASSYDSTKDGNSDFVVSKLSNDGSSLLSSTFIAATTPNNISFNYQTLPTLLYPGEIILNEQENPIVAINCISENFPTSFNAFQNTLKGFQDGAVACFSSNLDSLIWGTYIGGENADYLTSIRLDSGNNVIISGIEHIFDPLAIEGYPTTESSYQTSGLGEYNDLESIVSVLTPDASALLYSTYLSTNQKDEITKLEIDSQNRIWVCGITEGEFPIVGNVYNNTPSPTFIAVFNPELSNLEICTQIGAGQGLSEFIIPTAFMIDNCDRVYISGCAGAGNTFSNAMPLSENSLNSNGGFYLAQYSPNMGELLYATLFGGDHTDGGHSRFDKKGVVYQAVCSSLWNPLQAMPGAWSEQQGNGVGLELAVFKIDFESDAAVAQFTYETSSPCAPVALNVSNYSTAGDYTWWLDGEVFSTENAPSLTFNDSGEHTIQLSVYNEGSCNISDTIEWTIQVPPPSQMETSWIIYDVDLCADSLIINASFTGNNEDSLSWEFQGGSSDLENIELVYDTAGIYPLSLFTFDATCESSDTLSTSFYYSPLISQWEITASDPCEDSLNIVAAFTGQGADQLLWTFPGGVSTDNSLNLSYVQQGNYEVDLITWNESCLASDTLSSSFNLFGNVLVEANLSQTQGCTPLAIELNGQSNIGNLHWMTPFGEFPNNSEITFDQPGSYSLWCIAHDSLACNLADTVAVNIEVLASLIADMEVVVVPNHCGSYQEVNLIFTGQNADLIMWDTDDGTVLFENPAAYSYESSGTYNIVLTAENSPCNQQEIINHNVDIELAGSPVDLIFPNVISPNGDGFNDILQFSNKTQNLEYALENFDLKVFNQWGNLIFSSSSPNRYWDGNFDGEPVSNGVYFYTISFNKVCGNTAPQAVKGVVEVIR